MTLRERMAKAVKDGRASGLELALLDFGLNHGGSPAAALALACCQRASSEGHSCLDLQSSLPSIPGEGPFCDQDSLLEQLKDSALVVSEQRPHSPLVLNNNKLYLQRYWAYESRLADSLSRLIAQTPDNVDAQVLSNVGFTQALATDTTTDWQAVAAFVALRHRFAVISGGPGTGKTYTILRLMAALIQQALGQQKAPPVIRLAAPTGKAAARMLEAIRGGLAELASASDVSEHIPSEAQTLHRLLGLGFRSTLPQHHSENPLAADVVIVDEASMVDLPMMTKLLEALPPSCRLILLGDRYQLASVEAGSVLSELCQLAGLNAFSNEQQTVMRALLHEPVATAASTLSDHVVTLQTSRRFSSDSGIGQLAEQVNAGLAAQAIQTLRTDDARTALRPLETNTQLGQLIDELVAHFSQLATLKSPADALAYLRQRGVLCAVRQGWHGTHYLNQAITTQLAAQQGFDARKTWYHGRPIMVSRNDYQAGLYNGDTGICVGDEQGQLRVWFDTEHGLRSFLPSALPACDSVYALTVHKSQGSEYQTIDLILPQNDTRVLSRELIYTGITRAREQLCIHGHQDILSAAIQRPIQRYSGLAQKLNDAPVNGG